MNAYIRAAKKNSALRAQAAKQMAKREEQDKIVDPGKPANPNDRPKGRQ